jgi:hypothetical protein
MQCEKFQTRFGPLIRTLSNYWIKSQTHMLEQQITNLIVLLETFCHDLRIKFNLKDQETAPNKLAPLTNKNHQNASANLPVSS